MATLNIKDEDVYQMVRALADVKHVSMTEVVRSMAKSEFERIGLAANPKEGVTDWIKEFARKTAPKFHGETRTMDLFDDLYDEHGLPK
jgi:hypothetical protein